MQFLRRGDNWITRGKTSQSRVLREPTNSTRISCRVWKPNPGHIGGRRVLSPRRYHCSLNNVIRIWFRTHWTEKICVALPKNLTKLVSVKFSIRQECNLIILEIVITRAASAFHNLFMVMGCVFDINTVHKTVEKLRFQAFY